MATLDPDLNVVPPGVQTDARAEIGQPNKVDDTSYGPEPDKQYWLTCLDDAERAERDWRKRGRDRQP